MGATHIPELERVSIVIPCYNQALFLGEALESARGQTHPRLEILVVDDGSTDETPDVVRRFSDVRYIRERNRGLAAARNTGLAHSTGRYLVFLDADDRLLPHAIAAGLTALTSHPECACVAGHYRLISAEGTLLRQWPPAPVDEDAYAALLRRNHIGMHATVLYRSAIFKEVGGFDHSLRACEDYDLLLRIARRHLIHCYDTVVAEYRQHDANMSRNPALMLKAALTVHRRQWRIARHNPRHVAAYEEGRRFWQEFYGDQLTEALRARLYLPGRTWPIIRGLVLLRTFYPQGFRALYPEAARELWRPRVLYRRAARRLWGIARRLLPTPVHGWIRRQRQGTLGTAALRSFSWRLRRGPGPRALILLYHRVGDIGADPWGLAVTPERLGGHLNVLQREFRVVPLCELARALCRGQPAERLVGITFDDGYRETLLHMRTVIEPAGIPITAFLTAGGVDGDREFWWDELERILLHSGPLPSRLKLPVSGRIHRWVLDEMAIDSNSMPEQHRGWRAWQAPPGPRQATYRAVYDLLLPLRYGEQREALDRLLDWAGLTPLVRPTHSWIKASETGGLAVDPHMEIGAHTKTHPMLSTLPVPAQWEEIRLSRMHLETSLSRPVTSFAYPYGGHEHYTAQTVALVRQAGFARACINVPGLAGRRTDPFQVPRVQVQDWDAEAFRQRIFQWFDRLG